MELEIASKVGDLEIDATPDTDGDTAVPDFRNDQQISRVQLPSVERMSKATGSSSEGAVDLMLADHDAGLGAGVAVKKEAKPEEDQAGFDGAYDCLMCFTSCRGQPALHCTACTWNPWHVACAAGTQFERVCPQCGQESVAPWKRGKFTTLQQSGECVDLVAEEEAAEERQREREREESRKRELEERQRELEREEARKRELERAREEEKERARAREDATRREQERVDSAAGCTFDKGFQEARAQAARQVYARQEPHGYQAGKEDAEEEEEEEAEEFITNKLGHRAGGPACAALGGTKRAAPAASAGGSGSSKRRRRREADTAEAGDKDKGKARRKNPGDSDNVLQKAAKKPRLSLDERDEQKAIALVAAAEAEAGKEAARRASQTVQASDHRFETVRSDLAKHPRFEYDSW